jgi:hypothetical protein
VYNTCRNSQINDSVELSKNFELPKQKNNLNLRASVRIIKEFLQKQQTTQKV